MRSAEIVLFPEDFVMKVAKAIYLATEHETPWDVVVALYPATCKEVCQQARAAIAEAAKWLIEIATP